MTILVTDENPLVAAVVLSDEHLIEQQKTVLALIKEPTKWVEEEGFFWIRLYGLGLATENLYRFKKESPEGAELRRIMQTYQGEQRKPDVFWYEGPAMFLKDTAVESYRAMLSFEYQRDSVEFTNRPKPAWLK